MKKLFLAGTFIILILVFVVSGCGDSSSPPTVHQHELTVDTNTVALWHFNETSGNTAANSAGGLYPLTLASYSASPVLPVFTDSGRSGFRNCLSLDAANQQNVSWYPAGAPWADSFSNQEISVEFWCKFHSIYGTQSHGLFQGGDVDIQIWLYHNAKVYFTIGDKSNWIFQLSSNTALTPDVWHYVVCTYSKAANLAAIYIDGNLDKSQAQTPPATGTINPLRAFWIGSGCGGLYPPPPVTFFNGLMDEMRISNIARSATEISNYYSEAVQP